MINAKSFMEFFERECNVVFIDQVTGKRALDIIAENEKQKDYPYNHPLYKSDYEKFLESEEGKNILCISSEGI